jgi:hypothetical protein
LAVVDVGGRAISLCRGNVVHRSGETKGYATCLGEDIVYDVRCEMIYEVVEF